MRGLGLMLGIELKAKAGPYLRALQEEGVLALAAGLSVIRLLPPLVILQSEMDEVVAALDRVLSADSGVR